MAWIAYWIALIVWVLHTPMLLMLRARHRASPRGITLALDNLLNARMTDQGVTVWSANATILELVARLVGPPLVLWLVWLVWTWRHERRVRASALTARAPAESLRGAAAPLPAGAAGDGVDAPAVRDRVAR
jgi:hypothetical protein